MTITAARSKTIWITMMAQRNLRFGFEWGLMFRRRRIANEMRLSPAAMMAGASLKYTRLMAYIIFSGVSTKVFWCFPQPQAADIVTNMLFTISGP
jgi:hypothetical protein